MALIKHTMALGIFMYICAMVYKTIPDFPEYKIWSNGTVTRAKNGRLVAQTVRPDGNMEIKLNNNKRQKVFVAHKLIAIAFLDLPSCDYAAFHIDGNRLNNSIENIGIATHDYCKYILPPNGFIGIAGFDGYYVNKNGEVWRRPFISKSKGVFTFNVPRILSVSDVHGYCAVSLKKDGKSHMKYIHRLLMENFKAEGRKEQVNHIDGNKRNNSLSNLEWCTASENMQHQWDTGLGNNQWTKKKKAHVS